VALYKKIKKKSLKLIKKKLKKNRGSSLAGLRCQTIPWFGHHMAGKKKIYIYIYMMGFDLWGWFGHPYGQTL
jgi:hypothetical protein